MSGGDDDWDEGVRQAGSIFPDVKADATAFAAHAASCRARGALAEHVDELFLAWAAGNGDAAALRHLDRLNAPDLEYTARRVDRSPQFLDELGQAVRTRLFVADGGEPRILEYAGRGPLRGWVGVAALRVALNLKRATSPATSDILAELVSGEADPELRHLKSLYRTEFRDALSAALAALPERKRAILRLHYVDGLKLAQLARLYQVHESTASRWVSQAAAEVAEGARRHLTERLSMSPATVDSVARMVMSNLELSIARILGR